MSKRVITLSLAAIMTVLLAGFFGCLNDRPDLPQPPDQTTQFDKSNPIPRPVILPGQQNWSKSSPSPASIVTTDLSTQTAMDVVTAMVGTGPNAPTISNVTFTGDATALGTFSGGTGIIGFESGIVISSGNIMTIVGPNMYDDVTTNHGLPGDPDLDALVPGYETYDAAVLEFDFECEFLQVISFEFVFTSEEYNEYVNTPFNDVFGFFLNGTNIALLPDMVTPVAVNNVNCNNPYNPPTGANCDLFINNDLSDGGGAIDTEMDGLTVVLTATSAVNPGVNHFKLAIADAGDQILDSNVLIKAESFVCAPPVLPVYFDLKPTSCPNAYSPKNKGVTPAAILGTDSFNVTDIDPASLLLGGAIAPIRWALEDVATPVMDWEPCDCTTMGPDGYTDLTIKFSSQEIAAFLGSGVAHGDAIVMTITGQLMDGTPIEGMDCLIIKGKNFMEE
ncbi:MAG: choice-of-anchor L domain-containing protein [Candidatus Latescibacterota bacterium]|nr:MAG: choice-of-anchor L domain-containing protein [Candidatus Latescibacterota bacterium]